MCLKNVMENEGKYTLAVMVGNIAEKEDKTGAPYVMADLIDGESQITARFFRVDKNTCGFVTGDIIEATIVSSIYNGSMGYIVNAYEVPEQNKYNKQDFIISAPQSGIDTQNEIDAMIERIETQEIKWIVLDLLDTYKDKLSYWGAAKSMHHNYYGGLKFHSKCVAANAISLAENYQKMNLEGSHINMDLVIAGALLHDIGKVIEMETDPLGNTDYTEEGNLFGHLFMGAEIVKTACKKFGLSASLTKQLIHIIISHHDNLEWGAIKKPSTMEARIVATADMIDAQMEMMRQAHLVTNPGEFSEKYIDGARVFNPIV